MKGNFITGKEIYSLYLSLAISFVFLFMYDNKELVLKSIYAALGLLFSGAILLSKFKTSLFKVPVQILMGYIQAGVIMAIILSLSS